MRAVLALALVLVLPAALAQDHHAADKGVAVVLRDGPENGRAYVGAYAHFGFALLDKDTDPAVHQNAEFTLEQNGVVQFHTTDTHEYDGLFSFDHRFTRTGPYRVTVTSGEMLMGVFEGEVVEPVNATTPTIQFEATPAGPASRVVEITLGIVDAAGEIMPHTDAILEWRETSTGALHSRTHLHVHDEPIRASFGLGPASGYVAHVVAYRAANSPRVSDVPAVVGEFPVTVGPLAAPSAPMPALAPPSLLEQVGAKASADDLTLHAMYDPNSQVGVGQTARIAGIVTLDANHSPMPHVDFALTLAGPRGLVFSSENGHEYDGVFELLFVPDAPGTYDGSLTATIGDTVLATPIHLQVVPPAVPLLGGMGPVSVTAEGLDALVAGAPAEVVFAAMSPAGPAQHSEVDVTIFRPGEAPVHQFKLHTHDSGLTAATLVFPGEGEWQVRVDPLPTIPDAAFYAPALFAVDVAPGAPIAAPATDVPVEAAAVPGAWLALTLLALVLVARLR